MLQIAFLEIRKFDKIKRSDYNSVSEYIKEYQKQYYILARFKAAPHPTHALLQVLTNLELEVKKVHFITEEASKVKPKKITLEKVEEYQKALQVVVVIEGVLNIASNTSCGSRGGGRGSRGGNRGSQSGYNTGNDSTQTAKDPNAINSTIKKKKKGLRKQPTNDKDIYNYVREIRNSTTQKDDSNIYSFYGFGPYTIKRYAYLSETPLSLQELSGNLQAYSKAIQRA